jgi:nitrile hydratase
MGGMHGFGAVSSNLETDEPTFHETWEGRTFGLMITTSAKGLTKGGLRPHIESMPPVEYLAASYFERWAFAIEQGLVERGTLSHSDVDERIAHPVAVASTADPEFASSLARALTNPIHQPTVTVAPRFAVGQRVAVRRMAPAHHHRCPRYVRGASGTVTAMHGGWPLPHTQGHGDPEALYTVAFAMADLWGADAEPGLLHIDLWESYLE